MASFVPAALAMLGAMACRRVPVSRKPSSSLALLVDRVGGTVVTAALAW
ncbi:MAG: hypothetical protein ACR2KK_05340 [Acidimicrobiales bacterium]